MNVNLLQLQSRSASEAGRLSSRTDAAGGFNEVLSNASPRDDVPRVDATRNDRRIDQDGASSAQRTRDAQESRDAARSDARDDAAGARESERSSTDRAADSDADRSQETAKSDEPREARGDGDRKDGDSDKLTEVDRGVAEAEDDAAAEEGDEEAKEGVTEGDIVVKLLVRLASEGEAVGQAVQAAATGKGAANASATGVLNATQKSTSGPNANASPTADAAVAKAGIHAQAGQFSEITITMGSTGDPTSQQGNGGLLLPQEPGAALADGQAGGSQDAQARASLSAALANALGASAGEAAASARAGDAATIATQAAAALIGGAGQGGEAGNNQQVNLAPQISLPENLTPNDQQNVSRVVRGLQSALAQRGGTVTLRLTPPEMGVVRIHMELKNGVVRAQMATQALAARDLLTSQMGELRQSLERHGLIVERINVQTMPSTQSQDTQNQQQQQNANDGRSRGQFQQQQQQSSQHRRDGQPSWTRQFEEQLAGSEA